MKKIKIALYAIVIIILATLFIVGNTNISAPSNAKSQYFCDNELISFDLRITVKSIDGDKLYVIDGEIFSTYEDDLRMTDSNENIVRETNDIYNLISQNEHVIYGNNKLMYRCDGKIKLLADSYVVYDADGNKIANVDFNMFDTVGIMTDMDGDVIARYDSSLLRRDYIVSVFDKCDIDDESILMIFASYVSDLRADSGE